MDIMYTRCAGLDVHKKTVVACRMRSDKRGKGDHETQTFGTKTGELLGLVDWLMQWDVSHVAMESTGEYWKPIYNLLESYSLNFLLNIRSLFYGHIYNGIFHKMIYHYLDLKLNVDEF